jgi:hypothetical protein
MDKGKIVFGVVIIVLLLMAFYFKVGGTVVTEDNALEKCPTYFNVKCSNVVNSPEPEIRYVGNDNIQQYCDSEWGCYYPSINVIYMYAEDWKVLAHEQCHRFCGLEHVYENKHDFYIIKK